MPQSPQPSAPGVSKLAANLARVKEVLNEQPVKLIAVTKHASISQIEEVYGLGVTEFGESRIQDALKKREQLPPQVALNANWHFIGHLQSNKVKQAVGNFSLIHSVDSLKLAQEVSRIAVQKGLTDKGFEQAILLQVKLQQDDNKGGFTAADLRAELPAILALPGIKVQGLMTISPLTEEPSIWKESFNGLRILKDELNSTFKISLTELSMGMSDDWRDAIICGSTMIRLGRALFGH